MSDPTAAAPSRLREISPTIEDVCTDLRSGPEGASDILLDFAQLFLFRAPDELLTSRSSQDLASMVRGAFRFLETSRPYRVDVSVVNADEDDEEWEAPVTLIRTNVSERPFIIDSIREYLSLERLAIERMVYSILDVERDDGGRIVALNAPTDGGSKESIVHCEIERVGDRERLIRLQTELSGRLQDVVRSTDDFKPMLGALDRVVEDVRRGAEILPDRADELVAPRTLPPPSSRSPVLKSAHDTLALVRELGVFVAKHRSQYLREDKDADAVRDGIESEVRLSVQACQAHVDMLKSTAQMDGRLKDLLEKQTNMLFKLTHHKVFRI